MFATGHPPAPPEGVKKFPAFPSPALVNAYQAFTPLPVGARELTTPLWSPLVLYKPGRWVTVFGDMGDTSIRTWKSSMEDNHALERGVGHVFALGVCGAGQSVEREYHPTVPAFWHQSGQRVQVVEAVSSRRVGRSGGSQPSASPIARKDQQRDGRADCQPAGQPSSLGGLEDPSELEGLGSGRRSRPEYGSPDFAA